MTFEVAISDSAQADIQFALDWWRDNRSPEDAERWLDAIYPAIAALQSMPRRCGRAPEDAQSPAEIRQLLFGIGRRPTHRIVFHIDGTNVIVLRVRHAAQDRLESPF